MSPHKKCQLIFSLLQCILLNYFYSERFLKNPLWSQICTKPYTKTSVSSKLEDELKGRTGRVALGVSSSKVEIFCFQDLVHYQYYSKPAWVFLFSEVPVTYGEFLLGKKEWKKTKKTAAKYKTCKKLSTGLNHYLLHRPVTYIQQWHITFYGFWTFFKGTAKKQNKNQTAKRKLDQISSEETIRVRIVRKTVMSTCLFKSLVH